MIRIDAIKDLLPIIPELCMLFVPGLIFVLLYNWLNNKQSDIGLIVLWSLFVGFIINTAYAAIHSFMFSSVNFHEAIKAIVYYITAVVSAFALTALKHSKPVEKVLYYTNHKTINGDIFDDVFDYEKPIILHVYLKSCDYSYIGQFVLREEKGLDSWITLIDYSQLDNKTSEELYSPTKDNLKSSIMLNLNDIESIQVIYEPDSEVWKRISGEN